MSLKQSGKKILVWLLGRQVKRLRLAHRELKVIAVSGSVGKTSTKLAIAHVLGGSLRVRFQKGNYNDLVSVPLVFFGHRMPRIWNILAWAWILIKNELLIHDGYPYDSVVVELGTDGPGQLANFTYLKPDMTVITSVAAEHMEFFDSIDAVAEEEMSVVNYSQQVLINIGDIETKFCPKGEKILTYGMTKQARNRVAAGPLLKNLHRPVLIELEGQKPFTAKLPTPSKNLAKSALAAAVVADFCSIDHKVIKERLENLPATPGRMQILPGIHHSWLLDDTYNANPASMLSALKLLYEIEAPQRVAILGSMNELGDFSQEAHESIGAFCDSKKLDLVVTVGHQAYRYLAPAAESAGCKVERFLDPVAAGECVSEIIKSGAAILAKGSQNGVFTEEALKILLQNPDDKAKLVRQSRAWIRLKRRQFPEVNK